jgi:hypothetical protein
MSGPAISDEPGPVPPVIASCWAGDTHEDIVSVVCALAGGPAAMMPPAKTASANLLTFVMFEAPGATQPRVGAVFGFPAAAAASAFRKSASVKP